MFAHFSLLGQTNRVLFNIKTMLFALYVVSVCCISSVRRHLQTKHEKHFKDEADKAESIKWAIEIRKAKHGQVKPCSRKWTVNTRTFRFTVMFVG